MSGLSLVLVLAMQALAPEPAHAATQQALVTPVETPAPAPEPAPPPTPEAITAIPAELQALLRERVVGHGSRENRLQRLVDFMFDADGLALEYDGHTTSTVAQSFRRHKVNCLSFSLLFVALARQAGLDAYVQETDHVLAWYEGSGVLYSAGHVNAGVDLGHRRQTIDIDSSIMMTRGPPQKISDQRALAHYYNNRGAELMDQQQPVAARKYLDTAIAMAPDFLGTWNNLGVLEMRTGDVQAAERAYLNAYRKDPGYAATLSNLVSLYRQTGDRARAAVFEGQLFQVEQNDPFHHMLLALAYEQRGDFEQAVDHYRQAIRLHSDHRLYFGLARVYIQMGDRRHARRALERARDAAGNDARGLYQAKLEKLRKHRDSRNGYNPMPQTR